MLLVIYLHVPILSWEFRLTGTHYYLKWIVNIYWIIENAREFQKNIYFCFIDYAKSFDCVKVKVKSLNHVRLFVTPWTVAYRSPQSMEFSRQEYWSGLPFPSPDHSKLRKTLKEMEILDHFTSLLRNFYAEHIMRNAGLHEAQDEIRIAWKNINNLRYADETTLMAKSKE